MGKTGSCLEQLTVRTTKIQWPHFSRVKKRYICCSSGCCFNSDYHERSGKRKEQTQRGGREWQTVLKWQGHLHSTVIHWFITFV